MQFSLAKEQTTSCMFSTDLMRSSFKNFHIAQVRNQRSEEFFLIKIHVFINCNTLFQITTVGKRFCIMHVYGTMDSLTEFRYKFIECPIG